MKEKWKWIKGYVGRYKISSLGRVLSVGRSYESNGQAGTRFVHEKIMKQSTKDNLYKIVGIYKENKMTNNYVHQLVAKAFIPNPKNKPCVNHKDGVKNNNVLSNLEWVTHSENAIHSFRVLGRKSTPRPKKIVYQYDLNGNLLKEYLGTRYVKSLFGGCIGHCCTGMYNTSKGYKWSYIKHQYLCG